MQTFTLDPQVLKKRKRNAVAFFLFLPVIIIKLIGAFRILLEG